MAVEKADVVNADQLSQALTRIRAHFSGAGFGGVMQAAMVLEDCLFDQMTGDKFRKVVAPKVQATENLLQFLASEPLRFVILYSSISAVVGNFAQSNYASANSYLDAITSCPQFADLPLVSINCM